MTANDVAERARRILERAARAAERSGRGASDVRVIGASKTQPIEAIAAAAQAGISIFGENRVQELEDKAATLPQVEWHFIGQLQRNKARRAVELSRLIHSIDSHRLGETVARIGAECGWRVPILIEVNVGGEASKGGVAPEELAPLVERLAPLESLEIRGLMAIPPPAESEHVARRFFRRLRETAESVRALRQPRVSMRELSMGMSGDFEIAIEEGATFVRVGSALFGERG